MICSGWLLDDLDQLREGKDTILLKDKKLRECTLIDMKCNQLCHVLRFNKHIWPISLYSANYHEELIPWRFNSLSLRTTPMLGVWIDSKQKLWKHEKQPNSNVNHAGENILWLSIYVK